MERIHKIEIIEEYEETVQQMEILSQILDDVWDQIEIIEEYESFMEVTLT